MCFLYEIGNAQYGSTGATVFHDITTGNNSVPGQTGYSCGTGYSPVTGLGSVDANALVNSMQVQTGTFGLTVTSTGPGAGTVSSKVGGIDCGAVCFAPYTSGTSVTLTATANTGSTFTGWSGACTGTTCQLTITAPQTVTANFALPPGPPTIVSVIAGNGQATISFTDTASNGSTITSYTVTSSPGNITATGTGSPITITGLTDGTSYTFTVTATNAAGTSTGSASSGSVTPAAPVPALGPLGFMTAVIALGGLVYARRHG